MVFSSFKIEKHTEHSSSFYVTLFAICNVEILPPRFLFLRMFIKSLLSIDSRASLRLVSVNCGQLVAKYWNSLPVGFSVDRLSNVQHVILCTPSLIAKVYQFDKTSDRPSRAKASSSKIPALGEGASLGLVITSTTLSESMQTTNKYKNYKQWNYKNIKDIKAIKKDMIQNNKQNIS